MPAPDPPRIVNDDRATLHVRLANDVTPQEAEELIAALDTLHYELSGEHLTNIRRSWTKRPTGFRKGRRPRS
jgi:hypothetical protein